MRFEDSVTRFYRVWGRLTPEEQDEFYEQNIVVHAIYATTVIEGTRLSEEEVEDVLLGARVDPALRKDAQEVSNIKRAKQYISGASKYNISERLIKSLQAIVVRGVFDAIAGKYRTQNLRVGRYRVDVDWSQVPHKMADLVTWYNNKEPDARDILTLATEFHAVFELIHPFRDGNGRTGRLLFDYIMLRFGYPPLVLSLDYIDNYYDGIREYGDTGNISLLRGFFEKCYEELAIKVEEYYGGV